MFENSVAQGHSNKTNPAKLPYIELTKFKHNLPIYLESNSQLCHMQMNESKLNIHTYSCFYYSSILSSNTSLSKEEYVLIHFF